MNQSEQNLVSAIASNKVLVKLTVETVFRVAMQMKKFIHCYIVENQMRWTSRVRQLQLIKLMLHRNNNAEAGFWFVNERERHTEKFCCFFSHAYHTRLHPVKSKAGQIWNKLFFRGYRFINSLFTICDNFMWFVKCRKCPILDQRTTKVTTQHKRHKTAHKPQLKCKSHNTTQKLQHNTSQNEIYATTEVSIICWGMYPLLCWNTDT